MGAARAAPARAWALAAALGVLLPAHAAAARPVAVTPDQPPRPLRDDVEVLEDPAGGLTIDEVLATDVAERFQPNPRGRALSFGSTGSAYWFRFRLSNASDRQADLLLKVGWPLLDRIEFHAPGREAVVVGDTLPFPERPLLLRHFVLPLSVAAGATETFHLRVESDGVLTVPLQISSPARFIERSHGSQLTLGLLYGIFVGALLYNLFLWLSVRDIVNLYLVGHILSIGFGLACVDGLAFQVWPYALGWQRWAAAVSAALVATFTVLFVRSLVASPTRSPRLDRVLRWALAGQLTTTALASLWGVRIFLYVAMAWLIAIGGLLALTVIRHARRGHLPAKIYTLAWVVFLLLMTVSAASSIGILPGFSDLILVARLAAAAEVLLAAIAVAANLREARRARAASEEKFVRAFLSSPDALTLSGFEDGRFIEVNDAFEKVSGYSRAEALGRSSDELGLWEPGALERVMAELSASGSSRERDAVIVNKSGRRVPVQFSGERIELDGRQVLLATVRDVTERKMAAAQREGLIRELEAKNTELERFTYSASHDLRSPLVTILGFLGMLEKDARDGDRDRFDSDLNRIRTAANHMRRLLDELLELSRVGRVVNPPEQLPLGHLAEEAAGLFRETLEERGIELVIAPGLPTVHGDRTRLLQVLQNLLENAIRFLGDQAEPRIEIGHRRDGDDRVCFVRDNGIGIDPRHHEAVFELFRRLQPGVTGTGVGLALVRRIVEGHGGRIWVESEGSGAGSTFCFVIPRAADEAGSTAVE